MGKAAQGFSVRRTRSTPQPETRGERSPAKKNTMYGWTLSNFNAVDIPLLVKNLFYEVILRRIKVQYDPQFIRVRV